MVRELVEEQTEMAILKGRVGQAPAEVCQTRSGEEKTVRLVEQEGCLNDPGR